MNLPRNLRLQRFGTALGYGAFALVALVFGLYLTFPTEAVGQRIAHEVRTRSGGRVNLTFGHVSPHRLTGIAAERVGVLIAKPGERPLDLELDEVRLRLRLLPLLLLRLSTGAAVDLGDGTIEAGLTPRGAGAADATLEVEELSLASPPILPRLAGLPLSGIVSGGGSVEWRPDVRASAGSLSFRIESAALGPGAVSGFTVPATALGTLTPELVIEDGRVRVASRQEGGELQVKIGGLVHLRPQLELSQLDLCIQLKPEAAYLRKNPNVESALQLAEVRFRRDAQGFLNIPIGGTLRLPRPRSGTCSTAGRQ